MKRASGFNPEEFFVIPDTVHHFFADLRPRGEEIVAAWNRTVDNYAAAYPELAAEFQSRRRGELVPNWESLIPTAFPEKDTATRASSGLVFNPIAQKEELYDRHR